jgi:hypothetical protein
MSEELEEKKNHVDVDPFSRLMFGDKRYYEEEEKEGVSNRRETDWILGPKSSPHQKSEKPSFLNGSLGEYLQNVDYIEIMHHFDTLMNSANELKPLFKKVRPVLESFLNKK